MLTKSRLKFSKLYFPGLISLVLLPLICIIRLYDDGRFQKIGIMNIITANTESWKDWQKHSHLPAIESLRHYQFIQFTGNDDSDAFKQIKLTRLVCDLAAKKDLKNGICILFGKKSKYKDFVGAINTGFTSGDTDMAPLPYNDKIFIVKQKHYVQQNEDLKGGDAIYYSPKPSFYDTLISKWKKNTADVKILLPYWPSGIVFLLMIGLIVTKRRYYFINRSISTHD
jgi:hypothetical protein